MCSCVSKRQRKIKTTCCVSVSLYHHCRGSSLLLFLLLCSDEIQPDAVKKFMCAAYSGS